jgi:hypothetical protein
VIQPLRLIAVLCALTVFGTPLRCDAQLLKGIKKAAGDAVKKKAEEKIDGKPGDAPATSASSASAPAAAKDTRAQDVSITAERLDLILASYASVLPELSRQQRFFAAADSAERNKERFDACIEKAKEAFSSMSQAKQSEAVMASAETASAEVEKWTPIMLGISERSSAAQRADRSSSTSILLADSLLGVQIMMSAPMLPGAAKCGRYPFMPTMAANALSAKLRNHGPDGQPRKGLDATPTDAAKAAMSKEQFGRIRERIAFWTLIQSGRIDTGATPPFSPFTDVEVTAMNARKRDLMPLGAAWGDGVAYWAKWGNLAW